MPPSSEPTRIFTRPPPFIGCVWFLVASHVFSSRSRFSALFHVGVRGSNVTPSSSRGTIARVPIRFLYIAAAQAFGSNLDQSRADGVPATALGSALPLR